MQEQTWVFVNVFDTIWERRMKFTWFKHSGKEIKWKQRNMQGPEI